LIPACDMTTDSMGKVTKLLLLASFLIVPFSGHAAVLYSQNFDSLSNGDLNGQDSWSGNTAWDVAAHPGGAFGSGKVAKNVANSSTIVRDFSSTTLASASSYTVSFDFRSDNVTSDSGLLFGQRYSGVDKTCYFQIDAGKFGFEDSGGNFDQVIPTFLPTVTLWYSADMEVDMTNSRCRVVVNDTYYSDWVSMDAPTGSAQDFRLTLDPSTSYFDNISISSGDIFGGEPVASSTTAISFSSPVSNTVTGSTSFTTSFLYQNNPDNQATHYRLIYTHLLSNTQTVRIGSLSSLLSGTQSTSTIVSQTGTYSMYVQLGTYTNFSFTGIGTNIGHRFGVVDRDSYSDLFTTYGGISGYVRPDADTCDFNWSPFSTSTFVLADCVSYLFTPSAASINGSLASIQWEDKIPFVYLYSTKQLVDALFVGNKTSPPEVAVTVNGWEIVFINQEMIASAWLVGTLRILLVAGMYVMTALTVYNMLYKRFGANQMSVQV